MADDSKFKTPSEKTVKFLYDGVVAFYPDVAKEVFLLGKTTLPFHEAWGGFKRLEFLEFALNSTGTESIEEAAAAIRDWKEGRRLERTIPDKLDEMVARLEEQERLSREKGQKAASAYEKQKLAKDALLESQRAKETVPAPVSPAVEAPTASPEEVLAVGVKTTVEPGHFVQKVVNKTVSLPLRTAISLAYPAIKESVGPAPATAMLLWAKGVPSQKLEGKAVALPSKEAKKFDELVKAIKGIESGRSLQTRILQASFRIKDVTLLLGPDTGLTQAQVSLFFNPPETGGVAAIPHQSFFGNLVSRAGQQLFGKLASRAVKAIATKAGLAIAGEAVGTAAGTEAGAAVGAAAGGPAAPVTAIIGAVLGWLASKIPDLISWLKRNAKEFGVAAAGLLAAGVFFRNPFLLVAGLGVGGIALGAGGLQSAGMAAAGAVQGVLAGITGMLLPSIAVPVLVSLVAVPVVVALILFIINSGAYIVPPSPSSLYGAIESPYIGIEKTASPECMHRAGCPGFGPVTYHVKIWAKKGTLTNISIKNEYEIISRTNPPFTPPSVPEIDSPPDFISPTRAYEFTYTLTVGPSLDNSIVSDTITVTADAPGQNGALASQSAAVIVGNPPVSCPLPGGQSQPIHWSYHPGNESGGHGSNDYWRRMGGSSCRYSLPQGANCYGPTNGGNVCSNQSSTCDFYGYAMDVFPSGNTQVFAPTVRGQAVTWSYQGGFSNASAGQTFIYRSGSYYLVLTHLSPGAATGGSIQSGQRIGQLFPQGGNTHLHIEFSVSGRYVRPEDYFCR
ncbi:MAG TPA: M23 family metallopeptidase [Patescibacteria group bacterium]|uniref:Uncharacterized protein n=1 Tax=Candidatus Woesebacteria bacterium RBG_13_46_13 TaxID=1802479 RepID=A0A1F7X644_9BACT|nr:MAG: hypothetical protein A2Y68_01890 [Candidatus Woesebacteria bacterium RBG_13_46_13]HJX59335.1 M23 family metallopeptidase [Patescibacteria group bacterium]